MRPLPPSSRPVWLIIAIIILAVPLLLWPVVIGNMMGAATDVPDNKKVLMLAFPIYSVLSLYYAYRIWPGRSAMSVILLVLLALSYIAAGYLAYT